MECALSLQVFASFACDLLVGLNKLAREQYASLFPFYLSDQACMQEL